MKLAHFIKESNNEDMLEEVLNLIRSNCGPFLDEARGNLYRGVGHPPEVKPGAPVEEVLVKSMIRKNRRARDNKQEFNDYVDAITQDHVGFKMRSAALFTTTDLATAEHYGDVALIFPIGDFQFAWSPLIKDLYFTFFDAGTEDWSTELAQTMRPFIAKENEKANDVDDDALGELFSRIPPAIQRNIVQDAIETIPDVFFSTQYLGRAQLYGNGNEIMITNDTGYYQINTSTIRNLFEITPEEFYEML